MDSEVYIELEKINLRLEEVFDSIRLMNETLQTLIEEVKELIEND